MPLGLNIFILLVVAMVTTSVLSLFFWLTMGQPRVLTNGQWTPNDTFNFAKIILAIVGGIGGVVALVLAYRKQRLGEFAEGREQIKLFSERFTKATDQLGSEQAPVRLAGMYALEEIAHTTPEQRQTVVNVMCAYLRMPFKPPSISSTERELEMLERTSDEPRRSIQRSNTDSTNDNSPEGTRDQSEQEFQVRLATQRILASHLRYIDDSGKRPASFWPNIDLDFTGAHLFDIDFSFCQFRSVSFKRAKFVSHAHFEGAKFADIAGFYGAEFNEHVDFTGTHFSNHAWFEYSVFGHEAHFAGAEFEERADFNGAVFYRPADFSLAKLKGHASFIQTEFSIAVSFTETKFMRDVTFRETEFNFPGELEEALVWTGGSQSANREWPDGYRVKPLRRMRESISDISGWSYLTMSDVDDEDEERNEDLAGP
jgi:uncharacterized protein YjbI with pentapeptide repeats